MRKRTICRFLAAALLFAAGCSREHASILPTDPGSPPPAPTVTITSDRGQMEAGSSSPAVLTVTGKTADGTMMPDATEVKINTSLGYFGLDTTGKPVQMISASLSGGSAKVGLFAGPDVGTANILASIGTAVGRLNIAIVAPPPKPVADFTFSVDGLSVLFTDGSSGSPAERLWDFGDHTTSTEASPKHVYAAAGTYTVVLTVSNSAGTSSKSSFVTVTTGPPLVASFAADISGLRVLFTDTSTGNPVSWLWDFADAGTSSLQNPSHTYAQPGSYAVTLTVQNAFGVTAKASKFVVVTVAPPPQADFTFATSGLRAIFTDASTGNPTSWAWNFGDCAESPSSCTAATRNTEHTYAAAGTYEVELDVTNANGSSRKKQFVTVSLGTAPKASFVVAVAGLRAIFTDTSTGNPTAWEWNFGDCAASPACTATSQNADHTYALGGTYSVTLKASNAAGSSQVEQFVTVSLGTPPKASFAVNVAGLHAIFTDTSTGSPTAWEWNFGDCSTSPGCTATSQNSDHTYASGGTYSVSLTASNAAGTSQVAQFVTVSAGAPPVAAFDMQANGLTVNFVDLSTGSPTTWSWNFGDCSTEPAGCTSNLQNPVHTYPSAGTYTVTLIASNAAGSGRVSKIIAVAVPPVAAFTYSKNGLNVIFTDTSANQPTQWSWTFGDGGMSAVQNPAHSFAAAGTYTVSLTVSNVAGQSTTSSFVTVP